MVDIADLARKIKGKGLFESECDQVISAVEDCVIHNLVSPAKPDAKGISIYFPAEDKENFEINAKVFSDMDFNDAYEQVVAMHIGYLLSGAAPVEKELAIGKIDGDDNTFYIQIDPADIDSIYAINMVIGRYTDNTDKKVQILGRDTIYELDEITGKISSELNEAWETLNGQLITMDLLEEDESYALYGIPALLNDKDVDILVLYDEDNLEGKIIGARPVTDEDIKAQAKDLIQIKSGDKIIPLLEYETEDGDSGYEEGEAFVVKDKLTINVIPLPPGEYVYGFEVTDIYQNTYYSDWLGYTYE